MAKPILSPGGLTVSDFTNATHTHEAAATGGQLNATNVFSAGTVPTARLGSGSPDSKYLLRGDQSWQLRPKLLLSETGATIGSGTVSTTPTTLFTAPYTFAAGELSVGDMIIVEGAALFLQNSSGGGASTITLTPTIAAGGPQAFTTGSLAANGSSNYHITWSLLLFVTDSTHMGFQWKMLMGGAGGTAALVAANSNTQGNSATVNSISGATNALNIKVTFGNSGTTGQTWTNKFNMIYYIPNN
jgi:hypothetical protein